MSLRTFHLFFILLVILGADFFGIWEVYDYTQTSDRLALALGVISMLGGIGLLLYGVWFVRKLDRAGIH